MSVYSGETIIRELRIACGLTQKQLAEGICSRETICKIESGERQVDWFVFKQIMERLGEDPEKFYNRPIPSKTMKVLEWQKVANSLLAAQNYEELFKHIQKVEKDEDFVSDFGKYIYLDIKAAYFNNMYDPKPEQALECLLVCINHSRNDFDIEKIDEYFLTLQEVNIINKIAIAYARLDNIDKMISILNKLKVNFEKKYRGDLTQNEEYIILLSNLTKANISIRCFDKALETAEQGLQSTFASFNMKFYCVFLNQKANALAGLGKKDESLEYIKRAACIAYAMNMDITEMMTNYEKCYGEKAPKLIINLYG